MNHTIGQLMVKFQLLAARWWPVRAAGPRASAGRSGQGPALARRPTNHTIGRTMVAYTGRPHGAQRPCSRPKGARASVGRRRWEPEPVSGPNTERPARAVHGYGALAPAPKLLAPAAKNKYGPCLRTLLSINMIGASPWS